MVMFSQQRTPKSKMPTKPLRSHNPNQTMCGITLCLLDLNRHHARTSSMSSIKWNRSKRDRSSQVTPHNRRSVPRSSTQEHLQIPQTHFLENPRLRLESWGSIFTSHHTLLLYQRKNLPTNPTTLLSHPPRSRWIYHLSYRLFQQIWTAARV